MIRVTRCYRFPAAHVLFNPAFSDQENRDVFGKCANPNGHGHNYGVEVSVAGEVDPETGQVVPVEALDALFDERVRRPMSHRMLNELDAFHGLVPTAEVIARVVHERLSPAIAERHGARLARVRIVETPRNTAEYGDRT
ncbi:MAG: 6-pyruvoyl trahydropterin synthase family protein [Myxococcota bacterium]